MGLAKSLVFRYKIRCRPIDQTAALTSRSTWSHGQGLFLTLIAPFPTPVLIPSGDARALREGILFLLAHPNEARAMGERARLAAAPLTTQHCNELIWADALRLAEDRGRTAVPSTHTPSEVGKAEKNSLGNQV